MKKLIIILYSVVLVFGSICIDNFAYTAVSGYLYDGTNWTSFDYPGAISTYVRAIDGGNIVGYFSDGLPPPVVPIPSAIWLLGSGLIGIVGIRRKFKT